MTNMTSIGNWKGCIYIYANEVQQFELQLKSHKEVKEYMIGDVNFCDKEGRQQRFVLLKLLYNNLGDIVPLSFRQAPNWWQPLKRSRPHQTWASARQMWMKCCMSDTAEMPITSYCYSYINAIKKLEY